MHTIGVVTGFILIGLIIKTDINVNGIVVFVYKGVFSTSIHYMCFAREVTSKRLSRKIQSYVSSPVVRKKNTICTLCNARFKFTSIKFCYDIFSSLRKFLSKCKNNANQLYVAKCVQYLYYYHFVFKHVCFVSNSCKKCCIILICVCVHVHTFSVVICQDCLPLVSFSSKLFLLSTSIYSNSAV